MSFGKKYLSINNGQALVEYTLLVMLVALVFWVIKNANVGSALTDSWNKIAACMGDIASCGSAS